MAIKTHKKDFEYSPVAWFVMLENARRRGDQEAEQTARRRLAGLGVRVIYRRRAKGSKR